MKIGLHLYDFIRLKICPLYKIKELIDTRKNILEIGCGKGTFYRKFLINENNINYTGTDSNIKAIDLLKKYNQNEIKFIYEDIQNTIKRVYDFDCILLSSVSSTPSFSRCNLATFSSRYLGSVYTLFSYFSE